MGWSAGRIAGAVFAVIVAIWAVRLAWPSDLEAARDNIDFESSRRFNRAIYDKVGHDFADIYGMHIHHRYFVHGNESMEEAAEELGRQLLRHVPVEFFTSRDIVRVLDIGCGIGGPATMLARLYPHVHIVGINISPGQIQTAIELAERNGLSDRLKFHVMDAEVLDAAIVPDNYFDYIYGSEVIAYFQDRRKYFANVAKKLKRGGYYSVGEVGRSPLMPDDPIGDAREKSLADLKVAAERVGVTLPPRQPKARDGASAQLAITAERNWRIAVPFASMDEMIGYAGAAGMKTLVAIDASANVLGSYDDPMWVVFTVSFWKLLWSFGSTFYDYVVGMNSFKQAMIADAFRYGIMCFQKV